MIAPPISLTNARTGKRLRVVNLPKGTTLISKGNSEQVLGYYHAANSLIVYVKGSMPPELRTALQEGHLNSEFLLVKSLPAGIREIDITDCRQEFAVRLPYDVKG